MKVDNYGRRTWDTAEYEKLAKAREAAEKGARKAEKKKFDLYAPKEEEEEEDKDDSDSGDGFEDWDLGPRDYDHEKGPAVKRALLKRRDYKVDLDSKLGKSVVITKNSPSCSTGG